jgi:hypothetical protein
MDRRSCSVALGDSWGLDTMSSGRRSGADRLGESRGLACRLADGMLSCPPVVLDTNEDAEGFRLWSGIKSSVKRSQRVNEKSYSSCMAPLSSCSRHCRAGCVEEVIDVLGLSSFPTCWAAADCYEPDSPCAVRKVSAIDYLEASKRDWAVHEFSAFSGRDLACRQLCPCKLDPKLARSAWRRMIRWECLEESEPLRRP